MTGDESPVRTAGPASDRSAAQLTLPPERGSLPLRCLASPAPRPSPQLAVKTNLKFRVIPSLIRSVRGMKFGTV